MKTLGLVLAVAGIGVAAFGGYKYYQQRQGFGNLSEGTRDYNSRFAQNYWKRQAEIGQNMRAQQLREIATQRRV